MDKSKMKLIESGIRKVMKKRLTEGSGLINKRQYARARKGIELLANSLFDLQNVAVDDPLKQEKKSKYEEIRGHIVSIREILDDMV